MQSLQNIMSSCSLGPEAAKAVAWPAAMGSPSAAAASCRPPPPPPGADPAQAALILLLAVKVTSRASAPGQTAALLQDVVKQLEAGVGAAEILKRLAAHKEDSAESTTTNPLTNGAPQSCDDKEVSPAKNADLSNIISSLVTSAQNMLTAVQQQQQPSSQHVPVSRPSCSEPSGGESKKKRDPQLMDMLYKSFQARMKNGIYNPDRNGRRQFNHSRASPPKSTAPTTQVSGGHHNRPFCPKPIQGAKPTATMVSPAAAASPTIPAASPGAYPAPMIQQPQAAPTLMVPQQPNAAAQTNAAVFAQIQQQIAAAAAAASNPYALHQQAAISAAAQQQPPPAAYLTTNGLYQMPNPSAAAAAAIASNTFLSHQNAAAAQQLMWQQAAASQWQQQQQQQHSIQTPSQVPQPPQPEQQQQQQDAISAAAAAAAAAAAQTNGYYGAAYLLAGSKRKYELEQQHPSPSHEEAVKKLKLVHHHHPQPSPVNPGTIADMAASAAMYATTYT